MKSAAMAIETFKPPLGEPGNSNILRAPPENIEAERALLGAILTNNRAHERVADYLLPEHFADAVNGRIYHACTKLFESGRQANPVTLKNFLERDELVIAAGGMKYVASLANSVVTVINAGDYGRLIFDMALRRELIALGEDMVNDAFDAAPDESATDQIEAIEARLFELAAGGGSAAGPATLDVAADEAIAQAEAAYKRDGSLVGITTGLNDLDWRLGGLHPTDLIILAGRPSMGKSAMATVIAWNAAEYFHTTDRPEDRGKQVVIFSLEMSKAQLANRLLAKLADLDSHDIRAGRLQQLQFDKLMGARDFMRQRPILIDDQPAATVAAIRTRCRRLARRGKLGLVVIDYLQLIAPNAKGRRGNDNRVQELSAITGQLKALAKDLGVPVLALSQLSRAVENREDKRPQLADLRESGSIEQDSDVVMFVYREEYYLERTEPTKRADESDEHFNKRSMDWLTQMNKVRGTADLNIAKQRHGPIGTVKLHFDAPRTWFADLAKSNYPVPSGDAPASGGPPAGHPASEQLPFWEDGRG